MAVASNSDEGLSLNINLWLTLILGTLIPYVLYSWYSTKVRLSKVGAMAPMVPYRIPLGKTSQRLL